MDWKILFVVLSASFLSLSLPGFNNPALAWVAVVPLFLVIRSSKLLGAFLSTLGFGLIFYATHLWWMLSVHEVHVLSFGLWIFGYACFFGMFGLLSHAFQKILPDWNVITFPTIWVLLEYLRLHLGFLALPWGIFGDSQYTVLSVAWLAGYTGVYGISFLLVAVNVVLADLLYIFLARSMTRPSFFGTPGFIHARPSFGSLTAILIVLTALSFLRLMSPLEIVHESVLKVALIQGNKYSFKSKDSQRKKAIFNTYVRLTHEASESRPDLIAWPAASVPGKIPFDSYFVRELAGLAKGAETFVLVGAYGYDKIQAVQKKRGTTNSAFLFSPQGNIIGRYDKIRLLPFGEYIPLRGMIRWPSWVVSDMDDTRPGEERPVFSVQGNRFSILICWENMFPEMSRNRALQDIDFMVSMTSDAYTDDPSAHYQGLAMNVFRAIENHLPIIRTSTTGISALISPTGQILGQVQDKEGQTINVVDFLVGQIPLSSQRSFYTRYGDWFIYLLSTTFVGFMVFAWRRKDSGMRDEQV